jgi:hypothetical protein
MPRGAAPLTQYTRYYTGNVAGTSGLVEGVFLRTPLYSTRSSINIVSPESFPSVFDGGCGVIYMLYDVATEGVISIECNGEA